MSAKLIVVFGATGAQGGSVIDSLVRDGGWAIRAVTRDAKSEKAVALAGKKHAQLELFEGDASKPDSLHAVFKGAYGTFLNLNFWDPSSMGKEFEQGVALAKLAKEAGVQHIVYSTLANVEKESSGKFNVPHFTDKAKVAEFIATQNFKFTTYVAPSFYYQNFQTFFPPKPDEHGVLVFTLPETASITAFDVNETGAWVLSALKQPERWNGEYLPASGDHLAPAEYVRILGDVTGKKTRLQSVTREQFAKSGSPGAEEMADMFGWFNAYTYHGMLGNRENSIRANPDAKTFREWVAEAKPLKKAEQSS